MFILSGISTITKIWQVIAATMQASDVLLDKEERTTTEKVNAAMQASFAVLQTVDLGARGFSAAGYGNPTVSAALSTGSGALDVFRTGSQVAVDHERLGEQWNKTHTAVAVALVAGKVVIRGGEIIHVYGGSADCKMACEVIGSLPDTIISLLTDLPKMIAAIQRYRIRQARRRGLVDPPPLPDIHMQQLAKESHNVLYLYQQKRLKDLKKIPEMLYADFRSNGWYCKITDKPIRFVVIPNTDAGPRTRIVYEEEALKNWLVTHPGQRPPEWPGVWPLPLGVAIYRPDDGRQESIDIRIENYCKELH